MTDADPATWGPARVARWAGITGFVLPALTLIVYPIWSYPGTKASGGEVAFWASGHHDQLIVSQLLNTAGVTVWLVFAAAVWAYLRGRLPAGSMLPAAFLAGLVGCVTLLLAGFTMFDLLLHRGHTAETTQLLYDLTFGLLAMSGMPIIVAAGALARAVYAHRVLPKYTGHLALAVAITHPFLLLAFIVHDGPFSLQGLSIAAMPAFLFAWILGTALAMPRTAMS